MVGSENYVIDIVFVAYEAKYKRETTQTKSRISFQLLEKIKHLIIIYDIAVACGLGQALLFYFVHHRRAPDLTYQYPIGNDVESRSHIVVEHFAFV